LFVLLLVLYKNSPKQEKLKHRQILLKLYDRNEKLKVKKERGNL